MDNADIVRNAYGDFQRGDIASLLNRLHDDIAWITPGTYLPTAGTRRGKAEVAQFFQKVGETWDFGVFEPREFLSVGDRVIVLGYYDGAVKSTGAKTDSEWVMVWKFKDGKVIHFQEFTDTARLERSLA